MDQIIDGIAEALGIPPHSLMMLLVIIVAISNFIGRVIPDDATGWKGAVRKIASVIGLHVGNRVTRGISTNDVARAVVQAPPAKVREALKDVAESGGKPLFPGYTDREGS